mgnify:CR=1 FL=1
MKADLIADIWNLVVEHISEKKRDEVAGEFINTLLDYGIEESILESLMGVDPHLDQAIDYAIDEDGSFDSDFDDDDYNEKWDD